MSEKTCSLLFYFAAVCFFIAAAIGFINDEGIPVFQLCLGAVFLCIGSLTVVRSKKKADASEEDSKEDK